MALVLLLVGSIAFDYAIGRVCINLVTNTTIAGQNGNPDARAYVAMPHGDGSFPVVIMIQEFFGLNKSIIGKAQGPAEDGYRDIASGTFHGSITFWISLAIYQVTTAKPEQMNLDLDSAMTGVLH